MNKNKPHFVRINGVWCAWNRAYYTRKAIGALAKDYRRLDMSFKYSSLHYDAINWADELGLQGLIK